MQEEIKSKPNTEPDIAEPLYFEAERIRVNETDRADRMTCWLVWTLCALGLSAALHWQQARNLRTASQTILALQKTVFDLQAKASPAVEDFREPLKQTTER